MILEPVPSNPKPLRGLWGLFSHPKIRLKQIIIWNMVKMVSQHLDYQAVELKKKAKTRRHSESANLHHKNNCNTTGRASVISCFVIVYKLFFICLLLQTDNNYISQVVSRENWLNLLLKWKKRNPQLKGIWTRLFLATVPHSTNWVV